MKLDGFLRCHAFMRIERPPLLWEADTEDVRFVPLLGEMIVVGLCRGNELGDLTLNASNVTVEPVAAHPVPSGDYVAVTVRGKGNWAPEWTWHPGGSSANRIYANVEHAAANSGAVYAYSRNLKEGGSITVFFPRL
jgi:hypothetical protein